MDLQHAAQRRALLAHDVEGWHRRTQLCCSALSPSSGLYLLEHIHTVASVYATKEEAGIGVYGGRLRRELELPARLSGARNEDCLLISLPAKVAVFVRKVV